MVRRRLVWSSRWAARNARCMVSEHARMTRVEIQRLDGSPGAPSGGQTGARSRMTRYPTMEAAKSTDSEASMTQRPRVPVPGGVGWRCFFAGTDDGQLGRGVAPEVSSVSSQLEPFGDAPRKRGRAGRGRGTRSPVASGRRRANPPQESRSLPARPVRRRRRPRARLRLPRPARLPHRPSVLRWRHRWLRCRARIPRSGSGWYCP